MQPPRLPELTSQIIVATGTFKASCHPYYADMWRRLFYTEDQPLAGTDEKTFYAEFSLFPRLADPTRSDSAFTRLRLVHCLCYSYIRL